MTDHHKYLVWLSSIEGLGTKKANRLLKTLKTPKSIFLADEVALEQTGFLTNQDVLNISKKKYKENLENLLEYNYKNNIKTLALEDEDYPNLLKNIYDPPFLLYYKGTMEKEQKILSIIGSRKATTYGLKMAGIIAQSLGKLGFTVVSGMAKGIDSMAHLACVEQKTTTWAVLGCGVDVVYPAENRRLMEKIIERGAVISEFAPKTKPLPYHFPMRNRIISGLSLGVIVIEAGEKSGSLITANLALEQGREVFALPGNVMSTRSVGTNKLIKDGAKMITGIDDILEELLLFDVKSKEEHHRKSQKDQEYKDLGKEERLIIEVLETEELHVDLIARKTGIRMSDLNAYLIVLQLNGLIEQLPGKIYCLSKNLTL
jgi:DNA processing protein